jgi:hypothetical protein
MAQSSRQLRDAVILSRDTTPEQLRVLCFIHGYQMANKGATPTVAHVAASLEMSKAPRSRASMRSRKSVRCACAADSIAMDVLMKPTIPMIDGAPLYAVAAGSAAAVMPAPLPWQSTTVRTARLSSWRCDGLHAEGSGAQLRDQARARRRLCGTAVPVALAKILSRSSSRCEFSQWDARWMMRD